MSAASRGPEPFAGEPTESVRLERQLRFILEVDKLKGVLRRTVLLDRSRRENSAEHSWHLAVMAILLGEYVDEGRVDLLRVMKMLVVHDLVEIDAGDTFAYDQAASQGKEERERAAAERLFGLLPADQASEMRHLWDEFEARLSPEARFANALDRLQPMLHNLNTQGASWQEHGVRLHQVVERNRIIEDSTTTLWNHVRQLLDEAVADGLLGP